MDKKPIYFGVGFLVIGITTFSFFIVKNENTSVFGKKCTTEARLCPDGSYVSRSGKECAFELCKKEILLTATTSQEVRIEETLEKTPTQASFSTTTEGLSKLNTNQATATKQINYTRKRIETISSSIVPEIKKTKPSFFSSISSSLSSSFSFLVKTVTSPFQKEQTTVITTGTNSNPSDGNIPASSYITSSSTEIQNNTTLPPADFAGQKYLVDGNTILSNNNNVIYTIPPEVITAVSSPNAGWTNTTINVVPVGVTPPIINAIPITDLPGKYYLSENSFGNMEACEFSNKIFILDTNTDTVELIYEENNTTLSRDDPRACNSEIFLLATEGPKLVIKYHTIGTNTLCDSAWSEPEKTFYLDVTQLQRFGMRKYEIPYDLSANAENEEEACRAKL